MTGWQPDTIGDLSGKVAVVTGGTSGIGLETVRSLAVAGATVVIAARNDVKATDVARSLRAQHPGVNIHTLSCDLSSLESVRRCAQDALTQYASIDLLINNAGIMLVPNSLTEDGFESHLGTNHFGHFALTGLLLPGLQAAQSARVVTVSSLAHWDGVLDMSDLTYEHTEYQPMAAYRRSKLANLLFAKELDRRLTSTASSVASLACHPGVSDTSLAEHMNEKWWWKIIRPAIGAIIQGPEAGAWPTLRAAVDPDAVGGDYFGPNRRRETTGPPVRVGSSDTANDQQLALHLWDVSMDLTDVRYL